MTQATERSRLLPEIGQPEYVFDTSLRRERKQRLKQFQCCLCGIFLSILLIALIVTVSYSINNSDDEPSPTATTTNDTEIPVLILLSSTWPIPDKKYKNGTFRDQDRWRECIQAGRDALKEKDDIEKEVPSLPIRSPSYRHQKIVATSEKARNITRVGHVMEYAIKCLHRNKENNSVVDIICQNNNASLREFGEFCENQVECNVFQKYRTYDGICNNMKQPKIYGVSYRPFRRALPPDYADGISKPRASKNGKPLPSARTVSLTIHRSYYRSDSKFSIMLAVWGQFLDHDITATALSQKSNGDTISCCASTVTFPECFPVQLDRLDPFQEYNVSCIEFVRSSPAPTCCLGPREQLNQVTAFIDGSVVYGADYKLANKLRNLQNGSLKMYVTDDGRSLLPISDDINDGCNREEQEKKGEYCFLTGDARANENLHLTSMHLLWARQHNLLAANLSKLNPHWDDETIFQEARRIVGAQMQHITYNEFLPILLGNKLMSKFNLSPQKAGYFRSYKDSIDPNIANNFATAAFRFAHSIIPGLMKLLANDTSSPEFIQMHKMLLDPFKLYTAGELDKTLRGAMHTTIEARDSYFTNELKTHLFERSAEKVKQPKLCGLDLVSLNIQRGRDHGLPGYGFWRKHCSLKKPNKFDDLEGELDEESLLNIKTIYRHVDDIDLYTGALSEKPVEGSILGPTLTCLILDQFVRLKYGDRFWYENPQKPQAFTPEQLNEIRKTSLANIICDNSDNLSVIRSRVMQGVHSRNNYMSCLKVPRPNLILWKEDLRHLSLTGDSINVVAMENS